MRQEVGSFRTITSTLIILILVAITFLSLPPTVFGFELKGFSDITFTYARNKQDTTDPNTKGTFALGELDFFVSQNLGERVDLLTEFNFSADPNTNVGTVDIERLQIGYLFNDALMVRAGRFHTSLGYWNMTYHHGRQIQTTIERPQFLKFEDDGGLVPTHLVGLWVGGRFRTDIGGLEYNVMAGNGPRVENVTGTGGACLPPGPPTNTGPCIGASEGALSPNSTGDNSKNKAVSFQLRWMPGAIRGLGMGISGNIQQLQFFGPDGTTQFSIVTPNGSTSREVAQGIYGVDLEYLANNIEFLSEFYQVRDHGTQTFLNYLWYVQAGYKIADRFTPYARFERWTVRDNDPYFVALGTRDLSKTIAGVRFDIIPTSSLKVEYRFINQPSDNYNEVAVQWAFAF